MLSSSLPNNSSILRTMCIVWWSPPYSIAYKWLEFPTISISFVSVVIMTGRIRLFRSVRKFQRTMGIYSTKSSKRAPLNFRNLFVLSCFAQLAIPSILFFVFKANSFKDYADCFYAFSTSFACSSHCVVQMLHINNFELLTKKFEEFIEQSKKLEFFAKSLLRRIRNL